MPNSPITPANEARTNGTVIDVSHSNDLASALNRSVGYATQATAASTLTLTVASLATQNFTGTTAAQVVQMPVTSTLGIGMAWTFSNNSTKSIAVNSSGSNLIYTVPAGGDVTIICNAITGTTASSWTVSNVGYVGIPRNEATTGSYGVVAADNGTSLHTTTTRTITLPANGTIALPIGFAISFTAATGATVTIAITTDTMYLAGPGTTGSRTLAPFGMATAIKTAATEWMISGNGLT